MKRIAWLFAVAVAGCGGGGGQPEPPILLDGIYTGTVKTGGTTEPIWGVVSKGGKAIFASPSAVYTSDGIISEGADLYGPLVSYKETNPYAPALDNPTLLFRSSVFSTGGVDGTAVERQSITGQYTGTDKGNNPVASTFALTFDAAAYNRTSTLAALNPSAWEACDANGYKSRIVFTHNDGRFTGGVNSANGGCAHDGKLNIYYTQYNLFSVPQYTLRCVNGNGDRVGTGFATFTPASGNEPAKMTLALSNQFSAGVATLTEAPLQTSGPPCPQ